MRGSVFFTGNDEQTALGNGDDAFGSKRSGQELLELRLTCSQVEDGDEAAAFTAYEEQIALAEAGVGDGLRLRAPVARAVLWVVSVAHGNLVQQRT